MTNAATILAPARPAPRKPSLRLVPVLEAGGPAAAVTVESPTRSSEALAAEAFRLYGAAVYRRCLKLLKNPEAAQDACQDVFVRFVRDQSLLEGRASPLPWLYRVATNHCLNQLRNARSRGEDRDAPEALDAPACPGCSFVDQALARAVLARFDETTRLVAVGVLVEGMEHEELAEALGLSARSVARKLARFLEEARRYVTLNGVRELDARP